MVLVGMSPANSDLVVTDDVVTCRMGVGGWGFRGTVPRGSVVDVTPGPKRVWSWGVHGWRGRWLVNGSSKGVVVLHIEPASRARVVGLPVKLRELWVSVDDPAALAAALGHALA
jgi:hypothetical protein